MNLDTEDVDIAHFSDSDAEGGEEEHKRLMKAIAKLDKRKKVLPSERKEPSLEVSEFHLSKETSGNAVHVKELAKSLRLKASHVEIFKNLKSAQKKSKTLPAPLARNAAERIKRQVAYKNVKSQVTKWDPVVLRQKLSDDLVFPLKHPPPVLIGTKDFLAPDPDATDLEKQMAEVLGGSASVQKEKDEEEEFPLSLEEMIQRRRELARLRAQESYKQAKARRQNKIKSKKYHRYARRERIRQQIKEFEELQQKDPEAALQKLEELDKARILERASLRHRSTGQWAKCKAVRAKYDKESRQVLSEQLKFSKELTQKTRVESESSDDEELEVENDSAPSNNPWISQPQKTEGEIDTFLSGYRKYWSEKSQKAAEDSASVGDKSDEDVQETLNHVLSPVVDDEQKALLQSAVTSFSEIDANGLPVSSKSSLSDSAFNSPSGQGQKKKKKASSPRIREDSDQSSAKSPHKCNGQTKISEKTPTRKSQVDSPKDCDVVACGGKWTVTPVKQTLSSLDDMFDNLNESIARKTYAKLAGLRQELVPQKKRKNLNKNDKASRKRKSNVPEVLDPLELKKKKFQFPDEKLDEGDDNNANDFIKLMKENAKLANSEKPDVQKSATELDPNKFMKTQSVRLITALPDEITGGDDGLDDSDAEGDEREKMMTISEAFADDNVVADFSKEKQDAIDQSKPEDVNMHLPGWGSWGGHKIAPSTRKKRRFMVKMPEAPRRRDENKGNLFINETEDDSARTHQISDMPFPFSSVKDFEASVRAPIGNTFIPASAHQKLIKPAVRTKMGAIIKPMGKDVLIDYKESMKQRKKTK